MLRLLVRRVVVELEQVGALAVNTFMIVRFKHDPLLASCGVPPTIRCVDRPTFHVVQQHADEGLVEALAHGIVGDRCAVIERRPVTSQMDDDLSGQLNVLAQEQQHERIGTLLGKRRHNETVLIDWLPLPFQLAELLGHRRTFRCVRGRILTAECG